jgi:hypothetical protein
MDEKTCNHAKLHRAKGEQVRGLAPKSSQELGRRYIQDFEYFIFVVIAGVAVRRAGESAYGAPLQAAAVADAFAHSARFTMTQLSSPQAAPSAVHDHAMTAARKRPRLAVLLLSAVLAALLPRLTEAGLDMRLRLGVPFAFNPSVRAREAAIALLRPGGRSWPPSLCPQAAACIRLWNAVTNSRQQQCALKAVGDAVHGPNTRAAAGHSTP